MCKPDERRFMLPETTFSDLNIFDQATSELLILRQNLRQILHQNLRQLLLPIVRPILRIFFDKATSELLRSWYRQIILISNPTTQIIPNPDYT